MLIVCKLVIDGVITVQIGTLRILLHSSPACSYFRDCRFLGRDQQCSYSEGSGEDVPGEQPLFYLHRRSTWEEGSANALRYCSGIPESGGVSS
jgi:hypothetical protein